MEKEKCYIYLRVSTVMQIDGYSLDAQRDRIRKYAELHNMEIVAEYCDAGKSGKSIDGRPEFQRMIADVESEKDNVGLILVFKLSRFGRSCVDTLNTLDIIKRYDVGLVCVEDGIDSRSSMSKVFITFLSAIAEMERENIAAQTMAGRREKARQGGWNGGFAPTGYTLQDGKLEVNEVEAEVVRIIFDLYVNYDKSISWITKHLQEQGYRRERRPNAKTDYYSARTVKNILDSEVYMGKISYGKTKTEMQKGSKATHRVITDDYIISDGMHEALVSEELWKKAHEKREASKKKNYFRISESNHRYILSGLIKCPCCGKGLSGMNSRGKIKKDDTRYPDIHYYRCRHSRGTEGYKCANKRQLNCVKVDGAIEEIVTAIVNQERFSEMIMKKINMGINTDTLDKNIARIKKEIASLRKKEKALYESLGKLDIDDKYFERKQEGISEQLNQVIENINSSEVALEKTEEKKERMLKSKVSAENVYTILTNFSKIYDRLNDNEKYALMHALIQEIEVFEEKREDKRIIKSVTFKVPVIYGGKEVRKISVSEQPTDETVVKLSLKKDTPKIEVTMEPDEESNYTPEEKATYPKIKEYVKNKYGVNVHTSYIAQVKRMCGLDMGENYNKSKKEKPEVKQCPQEKVEYIKDALRHFKLI